MSEVIKKSEVEIQSCMQSQEDICNELDVPNFAPANGSCFSCGRDIYQNYEINGKISNGASGRYPVTGCPHCHKSFCD